MYTMKHFKFKFDGGVMIGLNRIESLAYHSYSILHQQKMASKYCGCYKLVGVGLWLHPPRPLAPSYL